MVRAEGHAHRKAPVLGLLTAALTACATVQPPPGGPPDFEAPVLLVTVPESATVNPRFDDDVEFQFNEVVDERSGGNLENLIRVSPRHDDVRVSWKRSRVTVKPSDGWLPAETYTITLLPGIADLRQNRFDSSRTIVFSTGDAIPSTRVAGNVINWETGQMAAAALVELIRPEDSVTYLTAADSVGAFSITGVPAGRYVLVATVDESRNRRRERREAFDSTLVQIDSLANFNLWTFTHDTTGPNIRTATFVDSLAIANEFTQFLAPDIGSHSARVLLLPDSTPVGVAALMWRPTFDSLRLAQRDSIDAALRDSIAAAADSIVSDSITTDSTVVATDSVPPNSQLVSGDSIPEVDPDAARREALIQGRPPLSNSVVLLLTEQLIPGASYVIEATVSNLLGYTATSLRSLLIPTPADST